MHCSIHNFTAVLNDYLRHAKNLNAMVGVIVHKKKVWGGLLGWGGEEGYFVDLMVDNLLQIQENIALLLFG